MGFLIAGAIGFDLLMCYNFASTSSTAAYSSHVCSPTVGGLIVYYFYLLLPYISKIYITYMFT